jgi:hypothetical protein
MHEQTNHVQIKIPKVKFVENIFLDVWYAWVPMVVARRWLDAQEPRARVWSNLYSDT